MGFTRGGLGPLGRRRVSDPQWMELNNGEIPMICWPYFGDQYIISRSVCDDWKVGLRLNENCERRSIETTIRTLMEFKKEEIQSSMDAISKVAHDNVIKGGSSHNNLELLIQDIRNMGN